MIPIDGSHVSCCWPNWVQGMVIDGKNRIEKALPEDDEYEIPIEQSIPKKNDESIPSIAIVLSRIMRDNKLDDIYK